MTPEQRDLYNCPNCSAPIGYNRICPYCGTRLRWEPYPDTLEYRITYVPVRNAEISVCVPRQMKVDGRDAPYLVRELVNRAAAFVVDHIRVKMEEDEIQSRVIYKARVGFADLTQDHDRGEYVRVCTDPPGIVPGTKKLEG